MRIRETHLSVVGGALLFVLVLAFFAALAIVLTTQRGEPPQVAMPPPIIPGGTKLLPAPPADFASGFAPVARRALPAVVNISSTKIVAQPGNGPDLFFRDPLFRQFFGNLFREFPRTPPEQRAQSRGSGVIVRADGVVLTNSHVIDGANEVRVVLADKRQFSARIKGADPKTDLAVLQIDGRELPTLPMGDSAKLEPGNFVLAIGDPFGIGETVTMGIVSAVGRGNLAIEDYEDFIQTDAAINPGNSGGALIDVYGNLVGINTAILSSLGGGNQGIGFAIPSNMASHVLSEILAHGKVIRGYLGVRVQDLTPALAKALGAPSDYVGGALVSEVDPGGPADQAGIRAGDILVQMDGEKITEANLLRLRVADLKPGSVAHLRLLRQGHAQRDVAVTLSQTPARLTDSETSGSLRVPMEGQTSGLLSYVQVTELTPQLARELGVPANTAGVVVASLRPGSAAADAGLRSGDIIEEINGRTIRSLGDFERASRIPGNHGSTALLLIRRGDRTLYLALSG